MLTKVKPDRTNRDTMNAWLETPEPTPAPPAGPVSLSSAVMGARRQLQEVIGLPVCSTLDVAPTPEGWRVVLEMLECKYVPDTMDLLASYEVDLDSSGKLLNFTRRGLRRRIDTQTRGDVGR